MRTDDNWEDWDMEAFIDTLNNCCKKKKQQQQKTKKKHTNKNKTEECPGDSHKVPTDPFKPERDPPKTPGERYRYQNQLFAKDARRRKRSNRRPKKQRNACLYVL